MDIFKNANSCINPALIEMYFRTDKSYWEKGELWTLNPLRSDSSVGSFSIRENGVYKDFAFPDTDAYNGDFIKLVSLKYNISLLESAEKIVKDSGGTVESDTPTPQKNKPKKPDAKFPIIITDVEREQLKTRANDDFWTKKDGHEDYFIKKFYDYRNIEGELLFYICRYERPVPDSKNQKQMIIFYMSIHGKWTPGRPENLLPMPLYGIQKIKENDLPVLIVSGEGCQEIAVNGYNLVTYQGGDNRVNESDWTTLNNRRVFIWPDNDESGYQAATEIKDKHLNHAIILDIPIDEHSKGWDIKNAFEDGMDLVEFIEEHKPKNSNINKDVEKIEPEIDTDEAERIELDPEFVYGYFLKEKYNKTGLLKLDSIYWRYVENKYYWKIIDAENIKGDIQLFLREYKFFDRLKAEKMKKTVFRNDMISYLTNHSLKFYSENPFLESAVSPYINFTNGIIKINENGYDFIDRKDQDIEYFKNLHPVNCFEFDFKQNDVTYDNLQESAPAFYYYIKNLIPKYLQNNESEVLKTFRFVSQMILYSMNPIKKKPYFFAFYGNEHTAKSSLVDLVSAFVGKEFIVSRSVDDMINNKFATSGLWNSKIYVDGDMRDGAMLPADFIKRNSGEETISIEQKHEKEQKGVKISIAMFFVSNFKMRVSGIEGINRRAIIVRFENALIEKTADTNLMKRITGNHPHGKESGEMSGKTFDERTAIMSLIMKEWNSAPDRNYTITTPDWIQKSTKDLLSEMTSTGEFLKYLSNYVPDDDEKIKIVDFDETYTHNEIYEKYTDWCSDEGRKPKGKGKFIEEAKRAKSSLEEKRTNKSRNMFKVLKSQELEDEELAGLLLR